MDGRMPVPDSRLHGIRATRPQADQATLVVEKLQRHGRRHARSKRRPREIAKVSRDRQSLELSRAGYTIFSPMGMLRIRLPHAAKIAFANAGPKGGTPGSPTPPA